LNKQLDARAMIGPAGDHQPPAGQLGALAHAGQAEMAILPRDGDLRSHAVVLNNQGDAHFLNNQADGQPVRIRMVDDIVHCFLGHAVNALFDIRRERGEIVREVYVQLQAVALGC